jgi:hypothetical protein
MGVTTGVSDSVGALYRAVLEVSEVVPNGDQSRGNNFSFLDKDFGMYSEDDRDILACLLRSTVTFDDSDANTLCESFQLKLDQRGIPNAVTVEII